MSSDQITFTAGGVSYSLVVTFAGTATSGTVQSITGTVGSASVTGLVSYDSSDQKVNAATPYFTAGGLSFVAGGVDYNLAYVSNYTVSGGGKYTGYLVETGTTGKFTDATFSPSVLTLTTNVCFVEGTRILTARGEVAVEDLQVGDLAVTAGGERRPIKWLGHRRVDCRNHPRAYDATPVLISAHAFGPDRPHRDLYVSPGHALCVNVVGEVFIRAYSLINGTTIRQIDADSVVYWHVELESHDVLLAENLPAESYFDMANRNFFVESGVVLIDPIPDESVGDREGAFCRPLHTDGPLIPAVRARLLAQAKALGWTLGRDPFNDLHMIADGVRIDPQTEGLTARFVVPSGARDVQLAANTTLPWNLPEALPDVRPLSICLKALSVDDGSGAQAIALDDDRLDEGFHALERQSWGMLRWMSGRARITALMPEAAPGGCVVSVEMLLPALPVWVAPPAIAPESLAA